MGCYVVASGLKVFRSARMVAVAGLCDFMKFKTDDGMICPEFKICNLDDDVLPWTKSSERIQTCRAKVGCFVFRITVGFRILRLPIGLGVRVIYKAS
jgi:hypothetical protein